MYLLRFLGFYFQPWNDIRYDVFIVHRMKDLPVLLLFSWAPGRGVPGYRGGLRPGVFVEFWLDANPSFWWSLVNWCVSLVSLAQRASPQLKGLV